MFAFCLYFFTAYAMENAVWQAARDIRTGRFQTGAGQYANLTGDDLKKALNEAVCRSAPAFVNCDSDVRLMVQSSVDFASIVEPSCLDDGGSLVGSDDARNTFDVGGASSVVLVTVCYSWRMASVFPFVRLGDLPDGSKLIQATAVFRTEPYNNT